MLGEHWGLTATDVTPINAGMNSSAWAVVAGDRYVAKVVQKDEPFDPGLLVAEQLAHVGLRVGPPVRSRDGAVSVVAGDHRVALLRWERGERLMIEGEPALRAIGRTLGAVHARLLEIERPEGLPRWPWSWLRQGRAARLRAVAAAGCT